jgi:hypothetical protein
LDNDPHSPPKQEAPSSQTRRRRQRGARAPLTLDIAELEVNGLSDCSVKIEPVRRNPRVSITAVTITWWRKQGEAYRDTLRELRRPKIGRMARLKGTVEQINS